MPGTAYVLFHHVMGECNGVRGVWGYVRGGMGGISNALAASADARGGDSHQRAVAKLLIRDGRVGGVVLEDGAEVHARFVASNADANVTFLKLADPKELPPDFVAGIKAIDYSSASLKINVLLTSCRTSRLVLGALTQPRSPQVRISAARFTSAPTSTPSNAPTTTPSTASRRGLPSSR